MSRPIRSVASVRSWPILSQDRCGSPGAWDSRVRGKPARGSRLVSTTVITVHDQRRLELVSFSIGAKLLR